MGNLLSGHEYDTMIKYTTAKTTLKLRIKKQETVELIWGQFFIVTIQAD